MNRLAKYFTSLLVTLLSLTFLILPLAYATDLPLDEHTVDHSDDSEFYGPYGAYVADMDNDGDIDILAAAWGAHQFAWWENSAGDGSSWIKRTVTTSSNRPRSVYAADINGDGLQDFVGAAFYNGISWWQNDGTLPDDGSAWTSHVVVNRTNFDGAAVVHAADVDQDGDVDVLGASTLGGLIAWWENETGDGITWIQHVVDSGFTQARSVYTADLDHDGDLDILGASRDLNMITWWEASPSGDTISWTRHDIDSSVSGATGSSAADVDGDGDMDVLGTSRYGNYISWWENDGTPSDGGWVEHRVVDNFEEAWTTYAFDMDQDGDLDILGTSRGDIATARTITGSVRWWENASGDGTTLIEHVITDNMPEARWVYPADFDQDGQLDIVATALGTWQSGNGGYINWWQNSTIHHKAFYPISATITSSALGVRALLPVDLNRDGSLDVLSASADDNTIAWHENDRTSSPSFTSHIISTAALSASAVFAADLNLDGNIDLLSASADDDKIAWYENGGITATLNFTETVISTAADGASDVYAADLDSDGDLDVISASANDDTIAWYENGGAGASPTFTETLISTTADGASALYVADLNRDGHLDVLSASANDDKIAWYENGGISATLNFTETAISTTADGASAVYAIDLDTDGDIDVLSASAGDNKVAWYENNGTATPSFTEYTISTSVAGASAVHALDVDLDGDIDVLAASKADDTLFWYESDGSAPPTFTPHTISTSADGAAAIYGADINSDGKPDIVSASEESDELTWYANLGGQFGFVTTDTAPASISVGEQQAMLQITPIHNGRSGDHNLELVTLELLIEEVAGSPLTSTRANTVIENLYIYLDDGSGSFEALSDTPVITVSTLALTDGIQTVSFTDNDPNVQITFNTPRSYFVALELTANAHEQANSLRLTHITEASSTARDADATADIPLSLAYTPNVSSSQSNISPPLAVSLANFSAIPTREYTQITWQTVSERENLGFHLYKGQTPSAPEKRLNEALIASQAPGSGQGASYEWQDHDIQPGTTTYYWLEDISINGTSTLHGPVSATTNIPTAVSITELKVSGVVDWWVAVLVGFSLVVTALAVQTMPQRGARKD